MCEWQTPSSDGWSACSEECSHGGPIRFKRNGEWVEESWPEIIGRRAGNYVKMPPYQGTDVEAAWRVLTVHHLDGDKANLRWWNLAALCQRCHLEIQAKVVLERVYPFEHSEWFKPYVAGYYAYVYLGEEVGREQALERMDELLGLELSSAT